MEILKNRNNTASFEPEEAKKTTKRGGAAFYDRIVYGMMIVAVIFVIIQAFFETFTSLGYRIVLGVWIMIAVAISDFIGPMAGGELDDYSQKQLTKYVITSLLDAVAYMCLYMFIIFVANVKEPLHYIFIGVAALLFAARHLINRTIGEPEGSTREPLPAKERITPGMTIKEALLAATEDPEEQETDTSYSDMVPSETTYESSDEDASFETEEPEMGFFKSRSK